MNVGPNPVGERWRKKIRWVYWYGLNTEKGQGMRDIARRYNVNAGTVSRACAEVESMRELNKYAWITDVCHWVSIDVDEDIVLKYIEEKMQPKDKTVKGNPVVTGLPIADPSKRTFRGWLPDDLADMWMEIYTDAKIADTGSDVDVDACQRHADRLAMIGPSAMQMLCDAAEMGAEAAEKKHQLPTRSIKAVVYTVTQLIQENSNARDD